MAETSRSTGDVSLDGYIGELLNRADVADRLKACRGDCPLLGIIRDLSHKAMIDLVQVDPRDTIKVIQRQEVAKLYNTIDNAIDGKVLEGHAAENDITTMEEEGYGSKG